MVTLRQAIILILGVGASGIPFTSSTHCTDYNVTVHVNRTTEKDLRSTPQSVEVLYALASKEILVTNSYNLSAKLCVPPNSGSNPLQLLVHGATFNKNMWDSQYLPEKHNWVQRMHREGYPTLAVDLIGNGNSSFPDGLLETQTQNYVETVHQLIQQLRQGRIGRRPWSRIAFVGFSIGSIIANSLAQQYPTDVDVIVLHGVSWDASWIYPAFLAGFQGAANQIDPVRWGHLQSYYQTQSTITGREAACFAGSYDRAALEYDWKTRDFDTMGAAITFTYHLVKAPAFKGPVFLGIGDHDSTFCGAEVCDTAPYGVYDNFPVASDHEVQVYPETGHLILFHHTGPKLMNDSIAFLRKHGF